MHNLDGWNTEEYDNPEEIEDFVNNFNHTIQAVQVTRENYRSVAKWANGLRVKENPKEDEPLFRMVDKFSNTVRFGPVLGGWLTLESGIHYAYSDDIFNQLFTSTSVKPALTNLEWTYARLLHIGDRTMFAGRVATVKFVKHMKDLKRVRLVFEIATKTEKSIEKCDFTVTVPEETPMQISRPVMLRTPM